MANFDIQVDEYIDRAESFAQPVLTHIRNIVPNACPEIKEIIKWNFPTYNYKGSILCHMASFKHHCAFGFWLASKMSDPDNLFQRSPGKTAMGILGQIKDFEDLPPVETLISYIHEAMTLIDKGVKIKKETPVQSKEVETPAWFLKALQQNAAAIIAYEKFSPSQKREYIVWLTEAKTEATQIKRLSTALQWIAEGKTRNWKYAKC